MRHKLVYKNSASFIYKRIYVSALVVTVKPSARFVRFVLGNVGMAIIFHFTFTETHFQSTSVGCVYICLLGEIFNIHRWCRSACTPAYYTIYTLSHMHTKSFSHSFTHTQLAHALKDQHPLYRCPICIYTYRHITSMAAMQNLSYLFALSLSLSCHAQNTHNKSNNWIKAAHG